jgi:hypothetical protein
MLYLLDPRRENRVAGGNDQQATNAAQCYRSLSDLSAYTRAHRDLLMAALEAYFDNSDGDTAIAFAGYVADVSQWRSFEAAWKAALDEFEVPYFHMKEFAKVDGVYAHLNKDHRRKAAFFCRLIDVIDAFTTASVSTCIRLNDLQRFNANHGLGLDPHALALYGCITQLLGEFQGQEIAVVIDRLDKAYQKIALAIDYAVTDGAHAACENQVVIAPLAKKESFKDVLPIQAADMISWELRKHSKDRDEYFEHYFTGSNNWLANLKTMSDYMTAHVRKHGNFPRERATYKRLLDTPRAVGYTWTYAELEDLHAMHQSGWRR